MCVSCATTMYAPGRAINMTDFFRALANPDMDPDAEEWLIKSKNKGK